MSLEHRMKHSAESKHGHAEAHRRAETNTLEELAEGKEYSRQAEAILSGPDGNAARDEISRFAAKISSSTGPEQYEQLGKLAHALNLRRKTILDRAADDEHERAAFVLALVNNYQKTLQ
jgi:hypothetical protein